MTCNRHLMFFCKRFCDVFEVFKSIFENPVFSLKSHAPHLYKWSNFSDTRWIVYHKVMFLDQVSMRIQCFEQLMVFHYQMLEKYSHAKCNRWRKYNVYICSKSSSKNQFWLPSGTMSPKSRGMFLTRQRV